MIQINDAEAFDGGLGKVSDEMLEYIEYLDSLRRSEQDFKYQIDAHKEHIEHWQSTLDAHIKMEEPENAMNYIQQQKAELKSLEEQLKKVQEKIELGKKWLEENS